MAEGSLDYRGRPFDPSRFARGTRWEPQTVCKNCPAPSEAHHGGRCPDREGGLVGFHADGTPCRSDQPCPFPGTYHSEGK